MKKAKNTNNILPLLVIFIILTLLLGSYIVYDKVLYKEHQNTQKETIDNTKVNKAILNILTDLVGLPNSNGEDMCLNYYISNHDYNKYAKEIMTYYGNRNTGDHHYFIDAHEILKDDVTCPNAADCHVITKSDAEKLVKLYNFSGNVGDYFTTINDNNLSEKYYRYSANHNMHGPCLVDLNITHNFTSTYVNGSNVIINDTQVLTYNDNGTKTINKTVEYEFRTDNNGNYYLHQVNVK